MKLSVSVSFLTIIVEISEYQPNDNRVIRVTYRVTLALAETQRQQRRKLYSRKGDEGQCSDCSLGIKKLQAG